MYLENIPTECKKFGINKLLVTRGLTIDWKHRDTEIHLRTPELLDKISEDFSISDIYKCRSQQLRHIYHISRSTMKNRNPDELTNSFSNMSINTLFELETSFFIDFELIRNHKELIPNNILKESFVFSLNINQREMIKYFAKHSIDIPKRIDRLNKKELFNEMSKNISTILYKENIFSNEDEITFWVSNFHLYTYIDGNNGLKSIKFKSDKFLPKIKRL